MKKKRQEYPLKEGKEWYNTKTFPPRDGEFIIAYVPTCLFNQFLFMEMQEGKDIWDVEKWRHAKKEEVEKFATPEQKKRHSRRYIPEEL